MATDNEIQRLAALGNTLRPDWPIRSLLTHLVNNHAHRSYRDLATALTWIATDPTTNTPARLNEPGPWWDASSVTKQSSKPVIKAHRCIDHPTQPASHCQNCHDQAVPMPDWFPRTRTQMQDMFKLPDDVAALGTDTQPALPTPAAKCGLCHDADTHPGRGICPECSTRIGVTP